MYLSLYNNVKGGFNSIVSRETLKRDQGGVIRLDLVRPGGRRG